MLTENPIILKLKYRLINTAKFYRKHRCYDSHDTNSEFQIHIVPFRLVTHYFRQHHVVVFLINVFFRFSVSSPTKIFI